MNKAIVVGYLGQDPEVKTTSSGLEVAQISIATNEVRGEKKHTEWHQVVLFGAMAKNAGKYLAKGSLVAIEGRIQTQKWQDKNGVDRWSTKIIASYVKYLSASAKKEAPRKEEPRKDSEMNVSEMFDEDIPF